MRKITQSKITALVKAGFVMVIGLLLFKYLPMQFWGRDIKFDASAHITITIFVLYVLWFYIDQNKTWRIPFFIFSLAVISIVSLQRIIMDAHNDVGLVGGLIISVIAILFSQGKRLKDKISF